MKDGQLESANTLGYDKWLIAEVGAALKEADDPNTQWVSNDDAKKHFARKHEALLKRVKAR